MKCDHCPVPEPFACCALTLPHPPYCWAMDPARPHHDPRHEPRIVAKSMSMGREVHPSIDSGPADGQPTATPTPPVNPHWERLMLIWGCDYRGPKLGCGCNETRVCWLGKGRAGEVTMSDCLACVSGPA